MILDDVDVKKRRRGVMDSAFMNAGQVCIALKRLYVPGASTTRCATSSATIAEGPAMATAWSRGVKVGPLQNAQQYEKAKKYHRRRSA